MSVLWNKIKSVCFFGAVFAACLLCGFAASARYVDAQTVYSYAKSGNYTALKYLGSGIDSEDAHGNTAVCLALADGNSRAYHTLLQYGANPNPRCSYAANIRNSSTTATGISSGGMSTTGWLLVGALVAGGVGIAVAAGGGGGGGGGGASAGSCDDTYMVSCPLGYSETGKTCRKDGKLLYECVLTDCSGYTLSFVPENCVIPEACRSGDVTTYRCATDGCKEGWHGPLCNIKDRCTYSTKECLPEEGYVESGEYCMSGDEKFVKCEERDCTGYEEGISVQHCTQYEECKSGHRNFARCDECEEGWDIATSCQEPSKCPYDTTECVSDEGFVETGNTCKSGDTTYVECAPRDCTGYNLSNVPEKCLHYDICITSEQQNVKRYINCTECMEGWVGEDCEDPDPCEGYSENCANGYVDSGDHCWHGTQELIMCVERDCSEYPLEIQPDGNCDEIESCQSGEKTTYKCNKCKKGWTGNGCHQKETCPYDTKECINGYEPTGNDCWSGDERFIECREVPCDGHTLESCPLNAERCSECKSDSVHLFKVESCKPGWEGEDCSTPSHCDYETLDCTGGYVATGNYCWSAGIKYTECKARECSFTTTSCEAGYEETGRTCQSAETLYRECQKITCPYHTIICAEGYHETGATCQSGSEVFKQCEPNDCGDYPLIDCPANAKGECERCQSGENIIRYRVKACKTGWTGQDCNTPDPSCTYRETSCDRTQGYEETGAYCYYGDQRYVECTASVCTDPPYDYDRCPSNAQSCGMCVTENETKYKIYSCKDGWEGADCGTAKTCGSGYEQTTCKDGYDQVGTPCQSGDVAYVKCEPKGCAGYNIDDACPANAESCGRCKSGEGYKYMVNSCKNGWTGERCDTPAACPYDKTECDGGYVPTGNKCKSGNTTYIECKEQTCGGYYESCGQGYVSVPGDTCQMGGKTLIRCKEKTCPAEYMESCPIGYEKDTSVEPCLSGQRRLYKCRAQSCDNYPATEQNIAHCTRHKSCQSGDQTKYRCDLCESGYTGDGAGRCKVIDSSTCVSEGYTYTEYGAGKECVTPGASKKCGDTTYYKCSVCKDGMKAVNGKCENQTESDCNNQGFWYNNANKAEKGCATLDTASSCKAGSTDYYKCSTCATGWSGPNNYGYCSATACSEEEFPYTEFGPTQDCVERAGGAQNQCQSGSVTRYKCSECNTARFNKQPENGICVAKTEEGCREDGYAYRKTDVGADKDCTSYKQESDPDNYCWVGATQYVKCTGCRDGMALNANNVCETVSPTGDTLTNTTTISYTNSANVVYGMKNSTQYPKLVNADTGKIIITGSTNSAYGMHGGEMTNYGEITISNSTGDYLHSGMYENEQKVATNYGTITLTNNSDFNYGMGSNRDAKGTLINEASGNIVMNGSDSGLVIAGIADGVVMTNKGNITINGNHMIYARGMYVSWSDGATKFIKNSGTIQITDGIWSTGIDGFMYTNIENTATGVIKIKDVYDGNPSYYSAGTGIFTDDKSEVTNNGTIEIESNSNSGLYGIWARGENITVSNNNKISVKGTKDSIYGIYAKGTDIDVTNSGTITITATGTAVGYGIYAEGENVTVTNTGTIIMNGVSCTGTNCGSTNKAIVLTDGATFKNAGSMQTTSLNTASIGGVIMASTGSKFEIEKALSGEIVMSSEVVTNGFEDTYTVADMIDAGDVSGLSLLSQSALFDAELQNESDAVLKMKSFDDVVANKSIADFLQQNYQEGNNEAFFNLLKEQDTMTALRQTVDSLTGDDVFNRFNFEDMTMMRELNMDINNTLFNNEERHLTTAGSVAPFYFDSNSGSDGRYALYNTRVGQKSLGMSLAFTHVNSSDRHDDNSRKDETFQMSVPFGYNTHGFKFISAPRFGYAYGTYDRKGYNRTYDGTVEKRMFGLMNEARYPVNMGNWSLAPAVEFNMLGYHVKGHEKSAPYALNIPGQKNYSVEAGVGLYANKDMLFGKNQKLKMNLGVAAYHEFVDPYETELEMQGMSGKFTIRDERHKDNRTVVRGGFDYQYSEEMSLIGTIATFVDGTTHTNANLDFRYHF